jgi:hypothetical protein
MRRNICFFLLATAFLMLQPGDARAYIGLCCSKCGGNMPLNIPGGGVPETKEFRFKISPVFMRMEGLRDGTSSIDPNSLLGMPVMMGQPTGKFMAVPENMDMSMFNLALGYSFTDDFFAGVMGMYQINRMDMRFNAMMQGTTGLAGYTMESNGFRDTMLMTKYRLFTDDPLIPTSQMSLLLGLNLPTGSIDERNTTHPLAMRQKELLPYGMQLGSGTFDPVLGLLYQGSSSPWWWGINGTYTGRWYDNDRDYRLGDHYRLDAYLMYQLRYDWVFEFQLNGEWQGRIRGEADESRTGASGHAVQGNPGSPFMTPLWDTSNYGGTNLFATVGLQWQPAPMHILNLQVGLPLYRNLNGPQLEKDWRIQFTWYVEIPTRGSIRYGGAPDKPSKLGF